MIDLCQKLLSYARPAATAAIEALSQPAARTPFYGAIIGYFLKGIPGSIACGAYAASRMLPDRVRLASETIVLLGFWVNDALNSNPEHLLRCREFAQRILPPVAKVLTATAVGYLLKGIDGAIATQFSAVSNFLPDHPITNDIKTLALYNAANVLGGSFGIACCLLLRNTRISEIFQRTMPYIYPASEILAATAAGYLARGGEGAFAAGSFALMRQFPENPTTLVLKLLAVAHVIRVAEPVLKELIKNIFNELFRHFVNVFPELGTPQRLISY